MTCAQDRFRRRRHSQPELWYCFGFRTHTFALTCSGPVDNTCFMADKKISQIVVLGAGFGGLTFCQHFRGANAQVTVVDRTNHYLFQPLLYQVAAAGLSAPEIAQPIRSILAKKPEVTVLLESVSGFDLSRRQVFLDKGTLGYDYLVLALGSCTSY